MLKNATFAVSVQRTESMNECEKIKKMTKANTQHSKTCGYYTDHTVRGTGIRTSASEGVPTDSPCLIHQTAQCTEGENKWLMLAVYFNYIQF